MQTNTKPFDPAKPFQTRDGRKARLLAADLKSSGGPIVAAITDGNGEEYTSVHHSDGRFYNGSITDFDLVNIPVRREGWVNVYRTLGGKIRVSRAVRETAELARAKANPGHIATVRIEWEEQ